MTDPKQFKPGVLFTLEEYRAFVHEIKMIKFSYGQAVGGRRFNEAARQNTLLLQKLPSVYRSKLPTYLLARCPICGGRVTEPVDTFSLSGIGWWISESEGFGWFGRTIHYVTDTTQPLSAVRLPEPSYEAECEHVRAVCYGVNLNGIMPDDIETIDYVIIGAEKPGVLIPFMEREGSFAVVHTLPVGRLDDGEWQPRYTVYFVTYFNEDPDAYLKSLIPHDPYAAFYWPYELMDYDLAPWLERGKLFWLGSEAEGYPLRQRPIEEFPYGKMEGLVGRWAVSPNRKVCLLPNEPPEPPVIVDYSYHFSAPRLKLIEEAALARRKLEPISRVQMEQRMQFARPQGRRPVPGAEAKPAQSDSSGMGQAEAVQDQTLSDTHPADLQGIDEFEQAFGLDQEGLGWPEVGWETVSISDVADEWHADSLNNKAVSLMEAGDEEEAMRCWQKALEADPQHPETVYNWGMIRWRNGKITDTDLVRQLEAVSRECEDDRRAAYALGLVHGERGDIESAVQALEKAAETGHTAEIAVMLERVRASIGESARCVRIFEGHTGGIRSVLMSADGHRVLSGSNDKTLRLWDAATGRCVRTFKGHTRRVNSVALSADGRWALSGSMDKTLGLWKTATGRRVRTFEGHTLGVTSVVLSPDGRRAFSRAWNEILKLWKKATGRRVRIFEGHTSGVTSVVLSPDGRRAFSGAWDEILKLWDVTTGKRVHEFGRFEHIVRAISWSADGHWILSGSQDKTLRLWEVDKEKCVRTFQGHRGAVASVALSADGRWALSGGWDCTVRLWDVSTGCCVRTFEGHTAPVNSVVLSADGRWALSGSDDRTVRLWEVATGRCVRTFEGHTREVTSVFLSADGRWAVSGSNDKTIRLWDVAMLTTEPQRFKSPLLLTPVHTTEQAEAARRFEQFLMRGEAALQAGRYKEAHRLLSQARSIAGYKRHARVLEAWNGLFRVCARSGLHGGWCVRTFEGHTEEVTCVALSADGRWALSGSADKTLRLWEVATGRCVRTFEGHKKEVTSVVLSTDGRWALSGSLDMYLYLWDVATGEGTCMMSGRIPEVTSVVLSADGRWALFGGWDWAVHLWDMNTKRRLFGFEGHADHVHSVALSADDRWILSGSRDKTLRLWNMPTGLCVRVFKGHTRAVTAVVLSADGRWALSGSWDKTLRLWKVPTGHCVRTFEGHTREVTSVALSADGRWALSGSWDKTLRLWEVATGRCVHTFEGHTREVTSVFLSADGRWALSGSRDKTLRLWELDWAFAEAHPPADWDEGARPYVDAFLTQHTPYAAELPADHWPSDQELCLALTRKGRPQWTEEDVTGLMDELVHRGYGWLRDEGVRRELDRMARERESGMPVDSE